MIASVGCQDWLPERCLNKSDTIKVKPLAALRQVKFCNHSFACDRKPHSVVRSIAGKPASEGGLPRVKRARRLHVLQDLTFFGESSPNSGFLPVLACFAEFLGSFYHCFAYQTKLLLLTGYLEPS